jgi:flagellin-like hook-associated protein FlgL
MDSIGNSAYNGVNLFEGTTPAPAQSSGQGQGALDGVAPNDPGVDISKLMNKTSAIWQKMNEKK